MSPDIRDMLQGVAPEPSRPLDLGRVRGRAQRLRLGHGLMMSVGVVAAVGLVIGGARVLPTVFDGRSDANDIPIAGGSPENGGAEPENTMPLKQRVAVVALEALTEAGMRDPGGSSVDYKGTTSTEGEWISRFVRLDCEEAEPEKTCTVEDEALLVHIEIEGEEVQGGYGEVVASDGALHITDVTGNVTPEEREMLVGYSAALDGGPPTQVFDPVLVDKTPRNDSYTVHASIYWTGPIPSRLETECRIEVIDGSGKVIYEGPSFPARSPRKEVMRDSAIATGMPRDLEWSHVRFACQELREKEPIPEDERIRPPAGEEEVIATGTFPDDPSMGVNAGGEWRLLGSVNDRYWCVRMAMPGEDTPGQNSTCTPFDLKQEDAIGGSIGTLIERTDGEPPGFHFFWGLVRSDVHSVKLGETEARVIRPPGDIPEALFVAIIPVQDELTIRAFAQDGTELGHRSVKLAQPPPGGN